MEIWTRCVEVIQRRARQGRHHRRGPGRGGHHQPARDDRGLGSPDRQARLQRDRLAGHAHRQDLQRARQGRRPGSLPRQGRPAAGDLLLRPEGQVDPRQRRGCPRQGRGRRPPLRQHRHLVHLEPDRRRQRRRARHRRDQRLPHDADEPRDPRLGSRDPQAHGHPARPCCRRSRPRARSTARPSATWPASRSRATSATSRRPSSARPASPPARRRTPTAPAASCS